MKATLEEKSAGFQVPVFALRREGSLGIGDVRAVYDMVDLADSLGMRFLHLLPICETVKGNQVYQAISNLAVDPALLDTSPEGLEDLDEESFREALSEDELEFDGDAIDYVMIKRLKLDLLWTAFSFFWKEHAEKMTERGERFYAFCHAEEGWLSDYSSFRLLMDFEGGSERWEDWSDEYGDREAALAYLRDICQEKSGEVEKQMAFYAYIQWVGRQQWRQLKEYAELKGVAVIADVSLGVSQHSADFFHRNSSFDVNMDSGGSVKAMPRLGLEHWLERFNAQRQMFSGFRLLDLPELQSSAPEDREHVVDHLKREFDDLLLVAGPGGSMKEGFRKKLQRAGIPPTVYLNGSYRESDMETLVANGIYGEPGLRDRWESDGSFRKQYDVKDRRKEVYGPETMLVLLEALFRHPGRMAMTTFGDLLGVRRSEDDHWLARYPASVNDMISNPSWHWFRREFRQMLISTGRLRGEVDPA
ncbi:MAG: 4-alpha-glucanotransferase [Verrucomicrobiota bacterium]